jgi:hypothetical protein
VNCESISSLFVSWEPGNRPGNRGEKEVEGVSRTRPRSARRPAVLVRSVQKKKRDRRCVCTHTRTRAKKASRSSHTADHQLALLGLTYVHALSSTRANSCAESPADLIKQLIFAGLRTQTQMPWSPLPRLQAAEFCKVGSCGFSQSEV